MYMYTHTHTHTCIYIYICKPVHFEGTCALRKSRCLGSLLVSFLLLVSEVCFPIHRIYIYIYIYTYIYII